MMRGSATYHVKYKIIGSCEIEKGIDVVAKSKEDAYDKAVYEIIYDKEQCVPYSAWVSSVTYNNGNCHYFNTSEGLPY